MRNFVLNISDVAPQSCSAYCGHAVGEALVCSAQIRGLYPESQNRVSGVVDNLGGLYSGIPSFFHVLLGCFSSVIVRLCSFSTPPTITIRELYRIFSCRKVCV